MKTLGLFLLISGLSAMSTAQDAYGADQANTRTASQPGGSRDGYNYMALRDHPGPSGVPLGGIGVGCVDLAPNGQFSRIGLNNWFTDGLGRVRGENPELERGSFLALWEGRGEDGITRRLIRENKIRYGMAGFGHTTYRGLFPIADIAFDDAGWPQPDVRVSVHAYSGLVPHKVKDSSLPCFWVEVTLANPMGDHSIDASVALSWSDVISRGVLDVRSLDDVKDKDNAFGSDEGAMTQIPHVPTFSQPLAVPGFTGVRQSATQPLSFKKATFQNYVREVAILGEAGEGGKVTYLPAWNSADGDQAWAHFRKTGEFESTFAEQPLSDPNEEARASAVAIKATIPGGGKRTYRFLVAWYMPELVPDRVHGDPRSYFGTGDYGRYFHNFFPNLTSLATYAARERARILRQTQEWHRPILDSSLPDWLKFKLINSAYTLYTNTILNRAGNFTVMEGGMGGLAGTMDQRLAAHPFYQKFFTELDHDELQRFADCQYSDGGILHFDGHYYWGMAARGGPAPTPKERMVDNTAAWLIQVAKDYQQTGDKRFAVKNAEVIRRAYRYLKAQIKDRFQIPSGAQTYDDYPHPPLYSYLAGIYPATLRAGQVLGQAIGDAKLVHECEAQFKLSQAGFISALWNGRFFAYGADLDGKNRRDDRVFSGQLAGEFVARYCGWGNVVPFDMTRASLITQFKTSVGSSPNYYAPKIWDLELNRGVDMPGSQCWPFYLESYTAMAAIQAGYVEDGLEIMRNIQLVHLSHGWTWTQNLWNPGELTYVAAPVTWFVTDVLAGASLDASKGRLTLGPVNLPGQRKSVIPLFLPRFWAQLEYEPTARRALLRITKTFGNTKIVLKELVPSPTGTSVEGRKGIPIPPFTVKEGATLNLSKYLPLLEGHVRESVLLHPGETPFLNVPKRS